MANFRNKTAIAGVALLVTGLIGCRGGISNKPPIHLVLDMDFQKKLKAQSESTFAGWTDHRGMRLPVAGTVARGSHVDDIDHTFATYDRNGDGLLDHSEAPQTRLAAVFAAIDSNHDGRLSKNEAAVGARIYTYKNADGTAVATNPLPATREVLERGRERFNINCAACHGRAGRGGIVAARWPTKVPDLVADEDSTTRARIVGYGAGDIVTIISEGKNTMPSYAPQIAMSDRWAIAHYLKALQNHFN